MSRKHLLAFGAFYALLWVPQLGHWFALDPSKPLAGVEDPVPLPPLELRTLWSGEYQTNLETNAARELGFRAALVRTDNQINLSLFEDLKPNQILGKHDVLFGVDHHPRNDWWMRGPETFAPLAKNIATLQEQLRARGIPMLVVISPNKGRLYPDDLPPALHAYAILDKVPTVHRVLRPLFDALHVEVADFAQVFGARSPSEPRVFANGGFHWNAYGAALATSEIMRRLALQSKDPWPTVGIESVEWSDELHGEDGDLIKLANVWTERRFYGRTLVPKVIGNLEGASKKRLLLVGTSFLWTIADILTQSRVLSRLEILFYFQTRVVFKDGVGPREVHEKRALREAKIDWGEELRGFDAVLLESPAAAINGLGQGFQDTVLRSFGIEPVR